MIGPLLGVLFSLAFRLGEKGGYTVLALPGRIIFLVLLMTGMIVGLVCGNAIDTRSSDKKERELN